MQIPGLSQGDPRRLSARVAGPAGLLVAKLHKIAERQHDSKRLVDKDAHDVYRLLIAIPTEELAAALRLLLLDDLAAGVTSEALEHLGTLFASGPDRLGAQMAARTEEGVGDPDVVAASVATLASDLLRALEPADA